MRDGRKQIVKSLITALSGVGVTVFTKVPKDTTYPYIHISEIYQDEDGPKNSFFYNYDILIQVVYKDLDSKVNLWNTVNSILGIIKNDASLTLTDDFEVMETTLISNSETEIMTDTGILDIGLIRILIKVEDKN